jgi:hypothetical protein
LSNKRGSDSFVTGLVLSSDSFVTGLVLLSSAWDRDISVGRIQVHGNGRYLWAEFKCMGKRETVAEDVIVTVV